MLQSGLGAVARHSLSQALGRTNTSCQIATLTSSSLLLSSSILSASTSSSAFLSSASASSRHFTPYLQHFDQCPILGTRSSSPVFWWQHQPRAFSSSGYTRLAATEDQAPVRKRSRKTKASEIDDKAELFNLDAAAASAAPEFLFDQAFETKSASTPASSRAEAGNDDEEQEKDVHGNAELDEFDDMDTLYDEALDAMSLDAVNTRMIDPWDRSNPDIEDLVGSLLEPDENVPDWFRRLSPQTQARTDMRSEESVSTAKLMFDLRQAARETNVAEIVELRKHIPSRHLRKHSYDFEIYAWALLRKPAEAHRTLKQMMEKGMEVTEVTCANVLLAYYRAGLTDDCFAMFEYLQSVSVDTQPDEIVYNLMMMTCAKAKKPERAMLFFEAMKQAGRKPGPVTFTALIQATSRCVGWYEETFRLVRVMKDEYSCNINDVRVWTSLLYACAYAGDNQGAKQVLLAITQYGHPVTDRYLALVLRCLAISSKHAKPNAVKENIATAERIWKQVELITLNRPHTFALNAYMDVYAKTGRVQKAEMIFRSYEKYQADYDYKSHTVLIHMYLKLKKFTEAEALFRRLIASGLEHDNLIFGSMVRGFAQANYFRSALRYLHEMIKAGIRPSPYETRLLAMKTFDYPHIRTMIGLLLKEAGITGIELQPYFRTNRSANRLFTRQKGGEAGAFKHALATSGVRLGMGPEFTQESSPTIFRFNRPRSMKPVAKRHGKTKSFRKGL